MVSLVTPLLRRIASDEFAPMPWTAADRRALAQLGAGLAPAARRLGLALPEFMGDRRVTAATLRAIDEQHGGGFYAVAPEAELDAEAAAAGFRGGAPVIDVQTHLVDPARWHGSGADALGGFLAMVDPDRWSEGVDPRAIDGAAWANLVFGASETAIALLTSTPGPADRNVLTNPQIAAVRDLVDRYAGTGRVLTHTIVHPNLGAAELDAMPDWKARLEPSGWKCYTLWGPATRAAPEGGWFLDDDEVGLAFLERVRELGPRLVATHKGLGGPIPEASVPAASPRDIGPAAAAFPDITFVVYHSGYERDPHGAEGPYEPYDSEGSDERRTGEQRPARGVDRLIRSVESVGIGATGNVYAELGSTWFLMLRRPREAAHVLGKLLVALGEDRILWGTDCAWYGSPQPLIDAFRAFRIPETMRERYGYPELTDAIKDKILSTNAQSAYGVSDATLSSAAAQSDTTWVGDAVRSARLP